MRRARFTVATALATTMMLAACGGGEEPTADESPAAPASSEAAEPATWPLTGLPAEGAGAEQKHPVYITKIDNTAESNPQVGLGSADLVVEELVEGGITRLAAFFYSDLPKQVGPVRSMRLTDIGIAKPADADIVTSGAAPATLNGLDKAGVTYVDMETPYVVRSTDGVRDSLHSVMADLASLGGDAKSKAARPDDYLPWGEEGDFPAGKKATSISAAFSPSHTSQWTYQGGSYQLTNGYMPKGDVFSPDTVIVCRVRTTEAGYLDPAGNPVPISHFEGKGEALLFHGGKVVTAQWSKDSHADAVTFSAGGKDVTIPAGHVWIELVPTDGGNVSYN